MPISFSQDAREIYDDICLTRPEERRLLEQFLRKDARFNALLQDILLLFDALRQGFQAHRRLFLCGNGGSCADAMHIAGELMKSFKIPRSLAKIEQEHFRNLEYKDTLITHLENGLPCIVLGLNHSLSSAIQNDKTIAALQYAQELYVLGTRDDMLLGISTSGNAQNVLYAMSTAKALGMKTFGLTGLSGGKVAQLADISVNAPESSPESVQELHIIIYHALCAMLEARFFMTSCGGVGHAARSDPLLAQHDVAHRRFPADEPEAIGKAEAVI